MDLILNGQAHGSVASRLLANGLDFSTLRPWVGKDGRQYVAVKNDRGISQAVPINNANATLRYQEWRLVDDAVTLAARERLTVVADIRGRGLTYNIPNGMGTIVLTTQRMGRTTPATISMDPSRKGESDRPVFDLLNLPLPVIHKDFTFTARQIAVSRNGGTPLDTSTAQEAARRVAEEAEKLTLGVSSSFQYGDGTVYGMTNFPGRLTYVLTSPSALGWTPKTTVDQIIAMRQKSVDAFNFGPWTLYLSPQWASVLDSDYSTAYPSGTLRERLMKIDGVEKIVTAYYLTGYQAVLCQMTSDVIREVVGMDITTLQWETNGGMEINFKVMAIIVPQIRADINGNTGIVHGATA